MRGPDHSKVTRLTKSSTPTRTQTSTEGTNDRRQEILNLAAELFAQRGYEAVGVRQIADAAGILAGSLYHHFPSKRDLYIEVHKAALADAAAAIEREIAPLVDPWERLTAACRIHLGLQVDPRSATLPLMSNLSTMSEDMRIHLVKDRDRFETIYKRLVGALPLRAGIDRNIYRLCLLSLINAVPTWYRPTKMSVAEVADQIVLIFRTTVSEAAPAAKKGAGVK